MFFTEEMLAKAARIPKETMVFSGIYFLYQGDKIVYIGQSEFVYKRITCHIYGRMEFDSFKIIECPVKELDNLESYLIYKYQPKYNKVGITKKSVYKRLKKRGKPQFPF